MASASITPRSNKKLVVMCMTWGTEFATQDAAIEYALHAAKDWVDRHKRNIEDEAARRK